MMEAKATGTTALLLGKARGLECEEREILNMG